MKWTDASLQNNSYKLCLFGNLLYMSQLWIETIQPSRLIDWYTDRHKNKLTYLTSSLKQVYPLSQTFTCDPRTGNQTCQSDGGRTCMEKDNDLYVVYVTTKLSKPRNRILISYGHLLNLWLVIYWMLTLNIIIKGAVQLLVFVQETEGIVITKILKLNQCVLTISVRVIFLWNSNMPMLLSSVTQQHRVMQQTRMTKSYYHKDK